MRQLHTDGALILRHDESHTLHDMKESMSEMIDEGKFQLAVSVKKGMDRLVKRILSRQDHGMSGYYQGRNSNLPASLSIQAI